MCLYPTSFDYLVHVVDLKPVKLNWQRLNFVIQLSNINDTGEPRCAFCITPSWPPFSVSVRLIENRITKFFSVNRLTENIPSSE